MAIKGGRSDDALVSASQVRRALTLLMPELSDFWTRPLIDYAHAVYGEIERGGCAVRNDAMGRLQQLVACVALRSGADHEQANDAAKQIAELPVIQSGPHCFLMIDPDAFYTHLFSALGLSSHRRRWHIYFGCSTVKFIERGRKGPGFLATGAGTANIFGLSRKRMGSTNLCATGNSFSFRFEYNHPGAETGATALLKDALPSAAFPTAADAIIAGNKALWQQTFPPLLQLVQFDDRDVGDLVAEHFEDHDSWLSRRFIGQGNVAEKLLHAIEHLNNGPWAGWVRRTTDFFWGLGQGRIFPLRLDGNVLVSVNGSGFSVPFDPQHVAQALRERRLVPNLLMMAIVTSILPGVRLLGGSRQVIYLPLMRHLFTKALDPDHDHALLTAIRGDRQASMWGHRVLKPPHADPLCETEKSRHGLAIAAAYGQQPLELTAGDLSFFTGDPFWAHLCDELSRGTIAARSDPWSGT